MQLLQPWVLYALPLIGLPIVIHLINQRRYRSIDWAATRFLLQARRMASGMARLRYWLILVARMLAIAGLILAIGRPMAGGWATAFTGGSPELTVVVVDRSPSMEVVDPRSAMSRRETLLRQLADLMGRYDGRSKCVVFDGADATSHELDDPAVLADLPFTSPSDTDFDLPGVLQSVVDFLQNNQAGRVDVWMLTDRQRSAWDAEGARWNSVRAQLQQLPGVRLCLLTREDDPEPNLAVRVLNTERRLSADGAELVVDLSVTRSEPAPRPITVPVTLTVDGARSTIELQLTGSEVIRTGCTVPVDAAQLSGWGRVEIPHDPNPADNQYHFVFAEAAPRRAVIVSDDDATARLFRLAAELPPDPAREHDVTVVASAAAGAIAWENTSLVIWHALLPDGEDAARLQQFVNNGGAVVFFPPTSPDDTELFGAAWTQWQELTQEETQVSRWTTSSDLLSNSQSGTPLPVGQLQIRQTCGLRQSTGRVLAELPGGQPLLVRMPTGSGGAWFCGTLPGAEHSALASQGITFYIMIQRALEDGAAAGGRSREQFCGPDPAAAVRDWEPLEPLTRSVPPSQRAFRTGVYHSEERLFSLNRSPDEDRFEILDDESLRRCLDGIEHVHLRSTDSGTDSPASEVWRLFLLLMIAALLGEALLCLPRRVANTPAAAALPRNRSAAP